jgi:hypothetical protein
MLPAPPDQIMTQRTSGLLICVYYRVAARDSRRVISAVREFQRTLRPGGGATRAEVLLRCDLPSALSPASPPDDRIASVHAPEPPAGPDALVDPAADATVMETYRLALPVAGSREADAAVRAFLALLESASLPHAGLLRGARHVELFAPCA